MIEVINIKNYIQYFYNLNNVDIIKKDNYYIFYHNGSPYIFTTTVRFEVELTQIYNLIKNNPEYDQIIPNINNQILTVINNNSYILIKKNNSTRCIDNIIKKESIVHLPYILFDKIDRTNWEQLWSEKIDYIEYQMSHIEGKYKLISESIWYYVGMAENAISYVTEANCSKGNLNYVISHKRILENDFNSPLNIVVDNRSRDISEYLKYIFINNKYDYYEIEQLINKMDLNKYLIELIYGRMFFATFYFDLYDAIVNETKKEEKIKKIILRVTEYEDYLKNIYNILNKNNSIPEINWLQ